MKNVLFATTALVASAGIASAEFSMTAKAKLVYGNYGTGIFNNAPTTGQTAASTAAGDRKWGSEADLVVSMSGGGDTVSYSAALEIDENGAPSAGPLSIATGGVTITYDANDIGDMTTAGADGEDDNIDDLKVAYAGNGITASYSVDLADNAYEVNLGYAAEGVSLGLETNGTDAKVSAGYTLGDLAVAVSANNAATRLWDASVAYTIAGGTTVTVATDEASVATAAVSTTLNGLSVTAKTGGDNELSVGYAAGDLGFKLGYDTGNAAKFGDEAQTTVVVDYKIDGLGLQFKANNQSEMEISTSLSF